MLALEPHHINTLEVLAAQDGRSKRYANSYHKPLCIADGSTWNDLVQAGLVDHLDQDPFYRLAPAGWAYLGSRGLLHPARPPYAVGLDLVREHRCPLGNTVPMACWFCMCGHATECHFPSDCAEARCSHFGVQTSAD